MSQQQRQQSICRLLALHGECSVEELTRRLGVSGMTVRRDLAALARQDKVVRTQAGRPWPIASVSISFFASGSATRRRQGCRRPAAAARIADGQSVLLDSGTTTLALARQLHGKERLTVITTSLPIAAELQFDQQIAVLLLGGYLRAGSPDLIGALTESNLETLRAEIAFLGDDGIDGRGCVYNESPEVARMLTKMAAAVKSVYVVADSSKLGRTALWRFGRLSDWTGLITNADADRRTLASLRKAGVRLVLAPD